MATKALSPLKRKPRRNPGQTLDEEIRDLIDDKLFSDYWFAASFTLIGLLEWYGYLTETPRMPWVFTGVALLCIAWAASRITSLRRRVAALKQGRDGERLVGRFLERLRSTGAQVLHDVPGDGFNLDHALSRSAGSCR